MTGEPPAEAVTASVGRDEIRPAETVARAAKPLVYVAGPITANPFGCVREAIPVWRQLRTLGCVPLLPQLSVLHEMIAPEGYPAWMEHDLDLVTRCDALVLLAGDSLGAAIETDYAKSIGLPVFHWPSSRLPRWLEQWPHAN